MTVLVWAAAVAAAVLALFCFCSVAWLAGVIAWAAYNRATRKHRHPGCAADGEPLSEDRDGEAEQFAALIWTYRNIDIPEPAAYQAGTGGGKA